MNTKKYQICTRCIMDTSDPEIIFDENGMCNHCTTALSRTDTPPFTLTADEKNHALQKIIATIKQAGKNKPYDCIIGLSGGVDSSYVAYLVKELGLRPLAVHLDNGWNSELSVKNIENICKILSIDLFTYIIDWEEFRDLQLAFLKASTPDSEIPSDHAIVSCLYNLAKKHGIKYIIGGTNAASEIILPKSWSQGHSDWTYIHDVWKKFGTIRPKTFPYRSVNTRILDNFRCKWFSILNYYDYDKEIAKQFIKEHLEWKDYGRKHGESHYTRIYQEYILPTKFGYDKRRAHYSSLIIAGQLAREEALEMMQLPLYPDEQTKNADIDFLVKKFGINHDDFDRIMALPPKTINDYKNSMNDIRLKLLFLLYKTRLFVYSLLHPAYKNKTTG